MLRCPGYADAPINVFLWNQPSCCTSPFDSCHLFRKNVSSLTPKMHISKGFSLSLPLVTEAETPDFLLSQRHGDGVGKNVVRNLWMVSVCFIAYAACQILILGFTTHKLVGYLSLLRFYIFNLPIGSTVVIELRLLTTSLRGGLSVLS